MRAVAQRVRSARVTVAGEEVARMGEGLLALVGVGHADGEDQAAELARKLVHLRIFEDANDKLNISVRDARGGVLVVSNFTLLADAGKGRRPSFIGAANADVAEPLTHAFVRSLRAQGVTVASGVFGATMKITSEAAGPVNVIIDTPAALAGSGEH